MDIQRSRSYYWTQGDFYRADFSVLSTGILSYLVHLVEWRDETFQASIHDSKKKKKKISTEAAGEKNNPKK